MHRFIVISLALAAGLANADPAHDVACREIGFSKSIENRDLEAFRSFLDADARFVSDRPRRGIEEIAAGWSVFIPADGPRIKWRPQFVEVLEDGSVLLDVQITQAELATLVGSTRQSVNAGLGELTEHGLLAREGRQLIILKPDELRSEARST